MRAKEVEEAKVNLSFYIEQDPYFNGTYKAESDFDKYCYEHCKDIDTVLNYIEELEEEKHQVLDDYQDLGKALANNFISKQVIRDKIEELEKEEKKQLKGAKGQDRYLIKQEFMYKKNILKELLEEEN